MCEEILNIGLQGMIIAHAVVCLQSVLKY